MDDRALHEQVALVTGGGRGIGRATALALAAQGANVCIAARTTTEIERVRDQCRGHGVDAMAVELDVEIGASSAHLIEEVQQRWGRIDILVHSAGIATSQKFTDIDDEAWQRTIGVNLTGAFLVTRAALPVMLSHGEGSVIAVASVAGKVGSPYIAAYTAAKHGLIGMMRSLASEYARSGITFNCICPGYVDTAMSQHTIERITEKTGRSREEALRSIVTPQGRLVDPDEVAALCVYLASRNGRSINGQAINIDGGALQS